MTNLSFRPLSVPALIGCSDLQLKHRRLDLFRLDQTDAEDANGILPRKIQQQIWEATDLLWERPDF